MEDFVTVLGFSKGSGKIYMCMREKQAVMDYTHEDYNEHWVICEEQDCTCTQPTPPIDFWMFLPEPPHVD